VSRWQQEIEKALFGVEFRLVGHILELFLADHVNGDLHQVANHGFNVAADVAHLGKLRRLDLQERRIRQLGQAARDLRLTHARGSDHDDVLGNDFFGQLGRQLLATHAVAQRDCHSALRVLLSHHVLVELGDDLTWRELVEH
jgi:hypothetical protein